jgi:hypothetical protein
MSHLRKIQVVDQEILWLSVLETTCSIDFMFLSDREKSSYMAVILYGYSFKSYVAL